MTAADDAIAKAKFLIDFNWKSYEFVRDMNEVVDNKIHNTIVVTGTIIPFLLGLFYFLFDKLHMQSDPLFVWTMVASSVGMVFFLLTTVTGLMSYAPKQFLMVGTSEFLSRHGGTNALSVMKQLVSDLAYATSFNRSVVVEKAQRLCLVLTFLVGGAAAFLCMFIIIGISLFLP